MRDPETIRARLSRAARRFAAECRDDPTVLGVAFAGSYVRGDPGPYSDVDTYALVSGPGAPSWELAEIDGVELEVFRHTREEYEQAIDDGGEVRQIIHPLATSRVELDTGEQLARLQRRAAERLRRLVEEPLTPESRASLRRSLVFGFRKAANAAARGAEGQFNHHLGLLLHLLPGHLATLTGRPFEPEPLGWLRDAMPGVYGQLEACWVAAPLETRLDRVRSLLAAVFQRFELPALPDSLTASS